MPLRTSSTTCPVKRCKNQKAEAARNLRQASLARAVDEVPDAERQRPKLCGLCRYQSCKGNHPCNHQRIGTAWINKPASEARIHGACPWGRSVINGGKP